MRPFAKKQLRFIFVGITCLALLFGFQNILQAQVPPAPTPTIELTRTPAELPPLPYDYDALEPYIDAETMELHHSKHHASYVDGLNAALEGQPELQGLGVEEMISNLEALPLEIRTDIRNNGGGHVNHSMFWEIMSPDGGGEPTGVLAEEINNTFGSFEEFQSQFDQAGENVFGSGWVWLVYNNQNQLQIVTTANQDTPIMVGMFPIMGNDVWEHAYYLNYRNERGEYLDNWWNVVNWDEIERRAQTQRS